MTVMAEKPGAADAWPARRVTGSLNAVISEVAVGFRLGGVDVRWAPRPCGLIARPGELREALQLVIDQAARRVETTADPTITVTAQHHGRWQQIDVADRGPAVPAELVDRFFDRGGAREVPRGRELRRAQRLVVGAGGSLRLDTSYEAGLRFEMQVPLIAGPARH